MGDDDGDDRRGQCFHQGSEAIGPGPVRGGLPGIDRPSGAGALHAQVLANVYHCGYTCIRQAGARQAPPGTAPGSSTRDGPAAPSQGEGHGHHQEAGRASRSPRSTPTWPRRPRTSPPWPRTPPTWSSAPACSASSRPRSSGRSCMKRLGDPKPPSRTGWPRCAPTSAAPSTPSTPRSKGWPSGSRRSSSGWRRPSPLWRTGCPPRPVTWPSRRTSRPRRPGPSSVADPAGHRADSPTAGHRAPARQNGPSRRAVRASGLRRRGLAPVRRDVGQGLVQRRSPASSRWPPPAGPGRPRNTGTSTGRTRPGRSRRSSVGAGQRQERVGDLADGHVATGADVVDLARAPPTRSGAGRPGPRHGRR